MKSIKREWNEIWLPEIKKALIEFKNSKTRYRQIPNILTASRLLSPIVIIPVALFTNVIATFVVTSLFALTDALDGKIARKYNLKSKLGAMLDPVTDKLFAFALLIPNITTFPIITTSIIALEGTIGFINSCSTLKGNQPHSNMLGKIKTTFVSITAIAMYLTGIPLIQILFPFLVGSTICLQISAATTYKIIDSKKDHQKVFLEQKAKSTIPKRKETKVEEKKIRKENLKQELLQEKESLLSKPDEDNFTLIKNK